MGQSIGLHVDASLMKQKRYVNAEEPELRRRTWYSMYVLDRLLALQLGRPYAIHDTDFVVQIPSRIEDVAFGPRNEISSSETLLDRRGTGEENRESGVAKQAVPDPEKPSVMDYFLCLIEFSHILGRVVQELYHPNQVQIPPEDILARAASLDASLSSWRLSLPYHLRFDLGHTFEKSTTFRRQV